MNIIVMGGNPPDATTMELIQFAKDKGIEIVYQQPMTITFAGAEFIKQNTEMSTRTAESRGKNEPWRNSPKRDKYKKQ